MTGKRFGFVVCVAALGLSACTVPGTVQFERKDNQWKAVLVTVPRENVTPDEIKRLEDRLNGK